MKEQKHVFYGDGEYQKGDFVTYHPECWHGVQKEIPPLIRRKMSRAKFLKFIMEINPYARLCKIENGVVYYDAVMLISGIYRHAIFEISINEIGNKTFLGEKESKDLLKWWNYDSSY